MSKDQPVEVDAVELKTVEIRLDSVKESTHRSRFIFIILTIVTSAILITLWNATLSWDHGLIKPPASSVSDNSGSEGSRTSTAPAPANPSSDPSLQSPPTARTTSARTYFIAEWVKNLIISVGLLGIRVSSNDLAIIGSISLIVVMTWYFYSQRRENRAIVSLLRDSVKGYKQRQLSREICYMIFQGIVHSLVFIDLGQGDAPLSGLKDDKSSSRNSYLVRKVLKALVYVAPFTIVAVVISDIWSLCVPSPMRDPNIALWYLLTKNEKTWAVIFESFAAASAVYTAYLCKLSTRFSRATTNTLKEYETFLDDPEKFPLDDPSSPEPSGNQSPSATRLDLT